MDTKKPTTGKQSLADQALGLIRPLYRIEKELADASDAERLRARQEQSLPQLEKIKAWLTDKQGKVMKDGRLYKAIHYCLNQWAYLIGYCQRGDLKISNALAENAIRPFALGRKNWLFADTSTGAQASAAWYSLIETAKMHGLNPQAYLLHLHETYHNRQNRRATGIALGLECKAGYPSINPHRPTRPIQHEPVSWAGNRSARGGFSIAYATPNDERPCPLPSPQPSPRGRGGERALCDFHTKVYKDQLYAVRSLLRTYSPVEPERLQSLSQKPGLTATRIEQYLMATQLANKRERHAEPVPGNLTQLDLSAYQQLGQQGVTHGHA